MDNDIAVWILEFLLRQKSLDDRLINVLISVLPLPNNNPSIKKSLILRKLESDIEEGTISERTLEFFEQIEELDHTEANTEVSEAMRAAYCAVAVHCTVKFIQESVGDDTWKYFSAVRRIWRGRIREMEKFDVAERVGLVSDNLLSWMDDIEAGVWDENVCENVLLNYKGMDVFEAVRCYLIEAKAEMGPAFLELVAETLSDDALKEIMKECDDQLKDRASDSASNGGHNRVGDHEGLHANGDDEKKTALPRLISKTNGEI